MSDPKDSSRPPGTPPASSPGDEKRSGRVGFDERGNSVWEWQLETGVYSRDISTQKLRKLDLNDLSIADTANQQRPEGLEPQQGQHGTKAPMPGGGFNPYDNTPAAGRGSNPYDDARAHGEKVRSAPGPTPAPPAKKPVDLKKLDEWIRLKKRLQERKDED